MAPGAPRHEAVTTTAVHNIVLNDSTFKAGVTYTFGTWAPSGARTDDGWFINTTRGEFRRVVRPRLFRALWRLRLRRLYGLALGPNTEA